MGTTYSAGEQAFIDQNTRRLLTVWCHQTIATGGAPPMIATEYQVYAAHAVTKGWLSSKDGRVLASGWTTAAAFLKR